MKSTIGRKIGFAFLVVLILMGIMVGITFQGFDKVISSLQDMELESVKRGASGNVRFSIAQLLMAPNDYIITEREYYHREYNRLSLRVDDFYRQFTQLRLTGEEQHRAGEIKQDLDSIRVISAQIFSIRHPRQSPEAWALMETMDYRFGEDVNLKATQIFDEISRRIEENRLQAAANKQNASNSIYGVTFLGIIISLVVSYLTVQRISKPIIAVTKAANGIANGDYSQRPAVKTHDEVAVLAESFSRMAESIQQSQRALEASKRLTETIVATVPSGLLVFGSDGKILSVNNSFCNIVGLVRDVLIDEYAEPVFKGIGISEECRKHILAHEPVRDIECAYSDPTKGTRILSLTLLPIRLTDGESLLVVEDVTQRKLSEQIIVDSEKRFRSLIENSSDGLVIISGDGTLLYQSLANSRILGYVHGELSGRNVFTLIHPDEFTSMMNMFAKLLKEPATAVTVELRVQHKDGTWRWIEATANNLLHDPTICGVVVNFRDITERKRTQEQLVFQSSILGQVRSAAIATDLDGRITYCNRFAEELFGWRSEDVLGKQAYDLVVLASGRARTSEPRNQIDQTGHWEGELEFPRKDGAIISIFVTGALLKDSTGRATGRIGILTDISERKKAEEIARAYSKRLQILSKQLLEIQESERRSVARELHDEIGQTLTSLKILLEISSKAKADNARESLQEALGLISGLIGRARDLSLDLRPPALDDLGLVPAIRWHLLHRTEKAGIEAHFNAEPEEIDVSAELKTTCFRVAQEALTNVLKHSKPQSVHVQIMKRGANLELTVRDDGTGFDVDSAFRRAAAGESFGLLGMQERVRLAGGTLVIRSEQGQGSEIQATFPNAFMSSL